MDGEPDALTWEAMSAEMLSGMRDWRLQHPQATLRAIETALDEHWHRLRARMLHDLALHSAAAEWKHAPSADRPACPACGTVLILRGKRPRQLRTHGGQTILLHRSYGYCPTCKQGLFPPG
jgi:predicted RNA-binding Zn-ribbon protein involved in translation (DUF1610 family)